jgi:hypothetical protein
MPMRTPPVAELLRTDHGYPCHYAPTVARGPSFRWGGPRFEVVATRHGVTLQGTSQELRERGAAALRAVLRLALAVSTQLSLGVQPADVTFPPGRKRGGPTP